jgi:D-alanyl-D-alanine carboxypeptidase
VVTLPTPFTHGYLRVSGQPPRDVTLNNPQVPWTSGGIVSTVPDMLTYAKLVGTGVGLSPATFKLRQTWGPLTTTGLRVQYGLGLQQLGDWIGHNGEIFGLTDDVLYLPSAGASLVVMANNSTETGSPSDNLWSAIVRQLYPNSLPNWPAPAK